MMGIAALNFDYEFAQEMREKGVRNPFQVSQELFAKRLHKNADGSFTVNLDKDPNEPSREEKDRWMIARDEYIARRTFYEVGYEEFLTRIKVCNIEYMGDEDEFLPCRSADRQCSLFCKWIGECVNGRRVNGNR